MPGRLCFAASELEAATLLDCRQRRNRGDDARNAAKNSGHDLKAGELQIMEQEVKKFTRERAEKCQAIEQIKRLVDPLDRLYDDHRIERLFAMTIDELKALARMMSSGQPNDRSITAVVGAIAKSEHRRSGLPE
jgi:hypothetical protein